MIICITVWAKGKQTFLKATVYEHSMLPLDFRRSREIDLNNGWMYHRQDISFDNRNIAFVLIKGFKNYCAIFSN